MNRGLNNFTDTFNITITISNGTTEYFNTTEQYSSAIYRMEVYNHTFNSTWTPTQYGRYNITITLNWSLDNRTSNNVYKEVYAVCPSDFQNDSVNTTTGPGYFVEESGWKITTASGRTVWAGAKGFYAPHLFAYTRTSLYSQIFVVNTNSYFVFEHSYNFDEYGLRYADVEITTDGRNWTLLTPKGGYPYSEGYLLSSGGYKEANFSLLEYIGKTVQIRMNLYTAWDEDYAWYYGMDIDTWFLDNFRLIPAPSKDVALYYL